MTYGKMMAKQWMMVKSCEIHRLNTVKDGSINVKVHRLLYDHYG